jgi:GxxExxY protein
MDTLKTNNTKESINTLTGELMNVFIKVHSKLGPGLLESVYEEVICFELANRKINFNRQVGIPVFYEGVKLEVGFRADIIVEDLVIIEIKSVETISPVHPKQLLTYLKLTDKKVGLLVNFNVNLIKDGVTRIANNF